MAENSDDWDIGGMQKKTEDALDSLEKKADKTSHSILQRVIDAVQKGLRRVTDSADEELKVLDNLSKSKVELEKSALESIEKLKEDADENERGRRMAEKAENQEFNRESIDAYRRLAEQKERLEQNTYDNSKALRGEYFSLGKTEWESYADYIYDMCAASVENLATDEKRTLLGVFREVRNEIEKSYEALLKNQGRMENKLGGFGGLYSNRNDKEPREIYYGDLSLDNMKQSTQALLNYEQYLTEVKEMLYKVFPTEGVSESMKEKNREYIKEFFAEVAELSVSEGAMFASYLTTQPAAKAEEYLLSWAKKQDLARAIAKKLYSDDQAEIFEESAASMSSAFADSLEKHFGSIPEGFYQKGVLSAKGFSDGFKAEMDNALSQISLSMENIFTKSAATGLSTSQTNVVNNSSYNIYSNQPTNTALEIYKYDTMKRMLVGG